MRVLLRGAGGELRVTRYGEARGRLLEPPVYYSRLILRRAPIHRWIVLAERRTLAGSGQNLPASECNQLQHPGRGRRAASPIHPGKRLIEPHQMPVSIEKDNRPIRKKMKSVLIAGAVGVVLIPVGHRFCQIFAAPLQAVYGGNKIFLVELLICKHAGPPLSVDCTGDQNLSHAAARCGAGRVKSTD